MMPMAIGPRNSEPEPFEESLPGIGFEGAFVERGDEFVFTVGDHGGANVPYGGIAVHPHQLGSHAKEPPGGSAAAGRTRIEEIEVDRKADRAA